MGAGQSTENDPSTSENGASEGAGPVRLYMNVEPSKWPILYSPNYDISFWKLESVHPFDSSKWRRVYELLKERKLFQGENDTVQPLEATQEELLVAHTDRYINSLNVRSLDH
jgi:histone deacetylase 11